MRLSFASKTFMWARDRVETQARQWHYSRRQLPPIGLSHVVDRDGLAVMGQVTFITSSHRI